ncbi:MAG: putative lipid II flippase FtsW [Clostridia bacterium]
MNTKPDRKMDSQIFVLTLLLVLIGLIMLFSASYAQAFDEYSNPYHYVLRQGVFAVAGVVAMYFISFVDYKWMHLLAIPLYVASVILLAMVLLFGVSVNEAQRWLNIAGIQFQPSEIAKTAIILLFSSLAIKNQKYIKEFFRGLVPYLMLIAVIAVFTLAQPHLSATVIITLTGIIIIYVAGANFLQLIVIGSLGVAAGCGFIFTNAYALTRIKVWLDPFSDYLNKGWQGSQSFITIGSGGLFGVGFGQGRQKHLYLPEPSNDFIFPVICEELGFIGALAIILLFGVFVLRGFVIAVNARDKFGMLLAVGITSKVAIQTIINLFVVTGLMPITGASLPFFSYGGTALLIQLCEIGVLINISRHNKKVN